MAKEAAAFQKDFGYLWPFFEKLAAHRPDDAALQSAVADAQQACRRIAACLDGEAAPESTPKAANNATNNAAGENAGVATAKTDHIAPPPPRAPAPAAWTVGPMTGVEQEQL